MAKSPFMARTRKPTTELLLPSTSVWQSWTGEDGDNGVLNSEFTSTGARFSRDAQRRVLMHGQALADRRADGCTARLTAPGNSQFPTMPNRTIAPRNRMTILTSI